MVRLEIPYATWQQVLESNTDWRVYERSDGETRTVWAGNLGHLYVAHVLSEHRTAYDAFDNTRTVIAVTSEEEAIARIKGIGKVANIHTEDGRTMIQPVTLDRELWHWYHSAGDVLGGARGGDTSFQLSVTSGSPTANLEWQYNDWVEMSGGVAFFRNADLGDHVSFKLLFPASVGTSTPSTGNANKVALGGGANMFVPAAGDGDWTLTLTDRTSVVPVPAANTSGYWEWSWPDEGVGAVGAGNPGASFYNLFDFAIDPATRFIPRVNLLGAGEARFLPENVHPTDILPHWKLRCDLNHAGGAQTLELVWHVVSARKKAI